MLSLPGILLGPSGLGQPYPCPTGSTAKTTLFPAGAPCDPKNPTLVLFPTHTPFQGGPNNIRNYLSICAQLGIVVFSASRRFPNPLSLTPHTHFLSSVFVVGLEVDMVRGTSGVP